MSNNNIPDSSVRWYVCDEGHVHLTFMNEDNEDILSVVIDVDDWLDLADAIDEEIDTMIAIEESAEAVKH